MNTADIKLSYELLQNRKFAKTIKVSPGLLSVLKTKSKDHFNSTLTLKGIDDKFEGISVVVDNKLTDLNYEIIY